MVRRSAISGVIVETGHRRIAPAVAESERNLGLPAVIPHGLPSDAKDSGFLVLRTDEKAAFARAYEYIASRGYRDVASLFIRLPGEVRENMRVFALLREMKERVPEEVSLMGYSNFPGSQLIQPALTMIDTRLRECAAMALKELLNAGKWFRPGQTERDPDAVQPH